MTKFDLIRKDFVKYRAISKKITLHPLFNKLINEKRKQIKDQFHCFKYLPYKYKGMIMIIPDESNNQNGQVDLIGRIKDKYFTFQIRNKLIGNFKTDYFIVMKKWITVYKKDD